MKTYITAGVFAVSLAFFSCDQDQQTMPESKHVPLKMEEDGYVRELIYDDAKRLITVKSTSTMPDRSTVQTTQTREYDAAGRLVKISIDDNWLMQYTYRGDRIVRTDEFRNNQPHQVHIFSHNVSGRVVEMLTLREENGEAVPVSRMNYVYDLEGNLMEADHYNFERGQLVLGTTLTYSGYDAMKSNIDSFGAHAVNPVAVFHTNNPGKMVVKNFNGVVTSTEDYTYQYDLHEMPTLRYTTVTFPFNGNSGVYQTDFFYGIL